MYSKKSSGPRTAKTLDVKNVFSEGGPTRRPAGQRNGQLPVATKQ